MADLHETPSLPGVDKEARATTTAARHDAVLHDYRRAVAALALELPGPVYDDFRAKSDALLAYMEDASDAYRAGYKEGRGNAAD